MRQEEINQLLAEIISMYAPSASAQKGSRWAALKLPTSSIEDQIPIASLPCGAVKAAFAGCGTILKDERDSLAGVIFAGSMNMNPAFMIVWPEDGILHIIAQAKEGLIKQHTAEKAIQKFKAALSLLKNAEEKRQIDEKTI